MIASVTTPDCLRIATSPFGRFNITASRVRRLSESHTKPGWTRLNPRSRAWSSWATCRFGSSPAERGFGRTVPPVNHKQRNGAVTYRQSHMHQYKRTEPCRKSLTAVTLHAPLIMWRYDRFVRYEEKHTSKPYLRPLFLRLPSSLPPPRPLSVSRAASTTG